MRKGEIGFEQLAVLLLVIIIGILFITIIVKFIL